MSAKPLWSTGHAKLDAVDTRFRTDTWNKNAYNAMMHNADGALCTCGSSWLGVAIEVTGRGVD